MSQKLRDKVNIVNIRPNRKHTHSIERYHFSMTLIDLDWDFKVALFFDIEYLRKGTT